MPCTEGAVVASALCLRGDRWLHYHLGATADAARDLGASNLLLYAAALWGQGQGLEEFHLGGGAGGEDSLFAFKQRFSPEGRREFWVGKLVHDEEAYRRLSGGAEIDYDGFFPAYRGVELRSACRSAERAARDDDARTAEWPNRYRAGVVDEEAQHPSLRSRSARGDAGRASLPARAARRRSDTDATSSAPEPAESGRRRREPIAVAEVGHLDFPQAIAPHVARKLMQRRNSALGEAAGTTRPTSSPRHPPGRARPPPSRAASGRCRAGLGRMRGSRPWEA